MENREGFEKVFKSLGVIGENDYIREKFTKLCMEVEEIIQFDNRNVRDEITGPVIDALHSKVGMLNVNVKPGLTIYFNYTSKMSRELVMRSAFELDHIWEPQTTKLLTYFAKNVEHVLIGGAYIGDQAIIVANSIKRHGGICHVFEANRDTYKILEINTNTNDLNNIKLNCIGLWSDDDSKLKLIGEDDLTTHPEVVSSNITDNDIVSTISINTYGNKQNIKKIGLIMLDIEGGEYEVLKGSDHYLSKPPMESPVLVFEVHRDYCDWSNGLENVEIIKYLKSFGYHIFAIRDYQSHEFMENNPIELIPLDKTYLEGPPHGFNMLGVKNKSMLENDIFRFCYNVSPKLLKHKNPDLYHPKYST